MLTFVILNFQSSLSFCHYIIVGCWYNWLTSCHFKALSPSASVLLLFICFSLAHHCLFVIMVFVLVSFFLKNFFLLHLNYQYWLLTSESKYKGSSISYIKSLVVDYERLRPTTGIWVRFAFDI